MHTSNKAVLSALRANAGIAISKFVVAFITSSSTMLAEAIHSSADCFNQILLLVGKKRSAKKADESHAFGYGKEEYFWSTLVAVVLFLLGSIFAVYEGIHKVLHPEPITNVIWIFVLLVVSIALEGNSFLVALKEFKKENKGSFLNGLKNSTDTSLIVVLIEDSGAMLGLTLALVFSALSVFVNPVFDGIGSIIIGTILGYMSYFLSNELRKLIVGENVDRNIRNDIRAILNDYEEFVNHINNMRAMYIGRNEFLLNVSLDINDDKRAGDVESIIFDMKNRIRDKYPSATFINIEISDSRNS